MYARVALAELCLLGQNQNIPILGSFWPQAWPFIFITINERSHYKDIQCIIPAKVRGKPPQPARGMSVGAPPPEAKATQTKKASKQ